MINQATNASAMARYFMLCFFHSSFETISRSAKLATCDPSTFRRICALLVLTGSILIYSKNWVCLFGRDFLNPFRPTEARRPPR